MMDYFGWQRVAVGQHARRRRLWRVEQRNGHRRQPDRQHQQLCRRRLCFTRSGTTWTQQAYIKTSNTDSVDYFGYSVSLSGDTLAVGASFEDSNATGVGGAQGDNTLADSGAVYVFSRSGTTWTQQAYLKASNTGASDYFGFSVSLSGDMLAVGAYGKIATQPASAATVAITASAAAALPICLRATVTTWSQRAYIKAPQTPATMTTSGYGLSLSAGTLAVGAYGEASNATGFLGDQSNNTLASSGAVYLFQ